MRHLVVALVLGFFFAALTGISLYINSHRAQILFQPVRIQDEYAPKKSYFRFYK